jgi:16S rRNA (guanine527-N7)-methyltransferase
LLALHWGSVGGVLVEASSRRCEFLRGALFSLELGGRIDVAEGRAETLARMPGLESAFDLVTARSFARPAVTAECGVRLLSEAGVLLVADPPGGPAHIETRWPIGGLHELGLRLRGHLEDPSIAVIARERPCPDRFPRRDGVPAKRPLF